MKHEIKVTFYLKKNETKEDGKCPVMARLRVDLTSQAVFSTRLRVPVSAWASGRMSGKSRAVEEINQQLDKIRSSAETALCELSGLRRCVTAEEVKCKLLGLSLDEQMLLSYFRAYYENYLKRVGINRTANTAKSYHHALERVSEFIKTVYKLSDMPFTALNRSFIEKFDLHLRINCGLAQGTIVLLVSRLRTVVSNAIAEGMLLGDPFAGYVCKRPKHVQKYLTGGGSLMTTPLTTQKEYFVRDLFLFSCFTGISYSDMCKLTDSDIEVATDGVVWIKTKRVKTAVQFEVPLLDLPRKILDRYRGMTSDGKLLPMYDNQYMNKSLKNIASTCGIERRLTFHVARHTFATTITLCQGIGIETISKLLGHRNISTTQIYAKITQPRLNSEMERLSRQIDTLCVNYPEKE